MVKLGVKIVVFIFILLILQDIFSLLTVKNITLDDTKTYLKSLASRIESDIKFKKGKWDTSLYIADPKTPYSGGASGFSGPLYIISLDGFVVDRNQTVNGFLDTSDFQKMLTYSLPQTITTITNENWRVLAVPVTKNSVTEGVVFASYYNPDKTILNEIDEKLSENIKLILRKVAMVDGALDARDIDVRNTYYDVSFEIVDRYNRILLSNGRVPSYIDPSYAISVFDSQSERTITDSKTKEQFLIFTKKLYDDTGDPVGIIVVGKSINYINTIVDSYMKYSGLLDLAFIIPSILFFLYLVRTDTFVAAIKSLSLTKPHKISFVEKEGKLLINDKDIYFPLDSNQYYLIKSLFSKLNKRWETDELLDEFGVPNTKNNWRKIYDAMLAINKKSGIRLIILHDKIYQVNPKYSSFIYL